METKFGERVRELRTEQNMLLRQLASKLDIDTSIVSKVERGERQLKKEFLPLLAEVLQADLKQLHTLWLADQVMDVLKNDQLAKDVLKTVSENLDKQ